MDGCMKCVDCHVLVSGREYFCHSSFSDVSLCNEAFNRLCLEVNVLKGPMTLKYASDLIILLLPLGREIGSKLLVLLKGQFL